MFTAKHISLRNLDPDFHRGERFLNMNSTLSSAHPSESWEPVYDLSAGSRIKFGVSGV